MNAKQHFLEQYTNSIACVLNCFDRVIFKGYFQRLCYVRGVRHFVDNVLKIRRKDFMPWAKEQSERIVQHVKGLAEKAGRPYLYLREWRRKDDIVAGFLRAHPIDEGLVCVLGCVEHSSSFRLVHAKDRPDFAPARPPGQVFYLYYLDRDLGLIHVRVPTLFPWSIQVAANGHDYLARQMVRAKLGFVQEDNVFVELDDPAKAQKLADGFMRENWLRRLDRLARKALPLMRDVLANERPYWVADQVEYATDIVFQSRDKLAELYPRLLDHAVLHFKAPDILGFLGQRLHSRYDGQVLTECKKDRLPGARIKHRVRDNWLKMYDKRGRVLRIETVINKPREFKVRRECVRRGETDMAWVPMSKSVCNLHHYQDICRAANDRYLQALAFVQPSPQRVGNLHRLGESCQRAGRRYAGFNPARHIDRLLFQSICEGQHLLHGFRNADIRRRLFPSAASDADRHRHSAATGRRLKRLHVRGLLLKVTHSRRWHVSQSGRELLTELLRAHHRFAESVPHQQAA